MTQKVIVITGASSGIGASLSRLLGAAGHRLVIGARRERELNKVAEETSSETLAVVTDVTKRADILALRDAAIEAFDRIDVWINNAGRGITRSVMNLTDNDFEEMMAVNVKAALYGMQAVVPHFQERGEGHLINVSSFLGRVPLASFRSGYNAAKHALNALTANLRVDLHATHPSIYVSLVMPGIVSTDFARNALGGSAPSVAGAAPAQTPEQVAQVIARVIEEPKAEVYTNPAQQEICRRYFEDVAAFEESLANH